jgi:prepilin peptidase CpaA
MIPTVTILPTLVFVALCIAADVRTRRIPNLLSATGMVAGIVLNTVSFGPEGLIASMGGLLAAMALLLFPFAMGGLGGGDVKMMGAIGALLGLRVGLMALVVGLVLGGVVMVIHLTRLGRLRETLFSVATMLTVGVSGRSLDPLRVSAAQPGAITLPYSVPLGLGTLIVLAAPGSFGL